MFGQTGPIYISYDSGNSWLATGAPTANWTSVASSADGTKLVAAASSGIATSTNSGTAWSSSSGPYSDSYTSVACSADGAKLILAGNWGLYTSTDSGVTWKAVSGAPVPGNWSCVASSADGTKLAAAGEYGIWTSVDSGVDWRVRTRTIPNGWTSFASSADGNQLVAASYHFSNSVAIGSIYTSRDSGATWTSNSVPNRTWWGAVASSADGTKLVALEGGKIYTWKATIPVVSTQPESQAVLAGTDVMLGVDVIGALPLSFQWQFNGTNLVDTTNATLTLTNVNVSNAGFYALLVTNSLGSVLSSNALLTVFPALITTQPEGQTVLAGTNVILRIDASGASPLAFQWRLDGTNLLDATNATVAITNAVPSDSGIYTVLVSNAFGSVLSSNAMLTVLPVWIATQPASGIANPMAVLNGQASPGLNDTTLWFEWGTNTNYGNVAPAGVVGAGSALANFESSITGLAWGTLYHYRALGSNSLGTAQGGDVSFVSYPPFVETTAFWDGWGAVGSSADGVKLTALDYGGTLFTSANSGGDWTPVRTGPPGGCKALASSTDGSKLVAAAVYSLDDEYGSEGEIYTSTDSGATWTNRNWGPFASCVASSADGSKLVAGAQQVGRSWDPTWGVYDYYETPGPIGVSTDSGATWTTTSAPLGLWSTIASSADGSKLVVAGMNSGLYTSTNSGVTWQGASIKWLQSPSVASSADGDKLVVADVYGLVYRSTDSGRTWAATGAPAGGYVACSADGAQIIVAGSPGIYSSSDSGTNWQLASAPADNWSAVAVSADGSQFVAAGTKGIYTLQTTPVPRIIGQPASQIVLAGSNATFSVSIRGATPVLYQWEFDGTKLPDATNAGTRSDERYPGQRRPS